MWRSMWPDVPLTNTWFDEPTVTRAELNHWKIMQWRDATVTRRVGWGWWPDWRSDPVSARMRREPFSQWERADQMRDTELPAFSRAHDDAPDAAPPLVIYVDALPSFVEREAGWPFRCFRVRWVPDDARLDTPGERVRGGVVADRWLWPWRIKTLGIWIDAFDLEEEFALPLTPMGPGLAANTLLWAGWWGLFFAVLVLPIPLWRRVKWRRRARLGCCIRCGYEIGGTSDEIARCPECGREVGPWPRWPWRRTMWPPTIVLVVLFALVMVFAFLRISAADRLPPFHAASAVGDTEHVRSLLSGCTAVDAAAPKLRSLTSSPLQEARALDWAAARGHAGVVGELLKAGADPSMVGDQCSPLALAMASGHSEVVELLLAAGASVSDQPKTSWAPIAIAAWENDTALLERLFDQADAEATGLVPLEVFVIALANRSDEVQQMVLDRASSSPAAMEDMAVFAWRFDDVRLFDALVDRGFDPETVSAILLLHMMEQDEPVSMLDALVARGVDPLVLNHRGDTMLHQAVGRMGSPDLVQRLIGLGVDVEAKDFNNATALHTAARLGLADVVRVLLDAGADATKLDARAMTARDHWQWVPRRVEGYQGIYDLLEAAEKQGP